MENLLCGTEHLCFLRTAYLSFQIFLANLCILNTRFCYNNLQFQTKKQNFTVFFLTRKMLHCVIHKLLLWTLLPELNLSKFRNEFHYAFWSQAPGPLTTWYCAFTGEQKSWKYFLSWSMAMDEAVLAKLSFNMKKFSGCLENLRFLLDSIVTQTQHFKSFKILDWWGH